MAKPLTISLIQLPFTRVNYPEFVARFGSVGLPQNVPLAYVSQPEGRRLCARCVHDIGAAIAYVVLDPDNCDCDRCRQPFRLPGALGFGRVRRLGVSNGLRSADVLRAAGRSCAGRSVRGPALSAATGLSGRTGADL